MSLPATIDTTEDTRFTSAYEMGASSSPFGFAQAEVYDSGVLLAICHGDMAERLVEALRIASGER
jgi:hypothetical protein